MKNVTISEEEEEEKTTKQTNEPTLKTWLQWTAHKVAKLSPSKLPQATESSPALKNHLRSCSFFEVLTKVNKPNNPNSYKHPLETWWVHKKTDNSARSKPKIPDKGLVLCFNRTDLAGTFAARIATLHHRMRIMLFHQG